MYIFLSTWRVILYFKEVVTIKAFLESLKNFLDSKGEIQRSYETKTIIEFFFMEVYSNGTNL